MTYELVYKDGQEPLEVTRSQACVIASHFVEKCVEHEKKIHVVKKAIFDSMRGIVVTTTTSEKFVHVGLGKPGKRFFSHPRVRVRDNMKPRINVKLKCTCGKCKICYYREYHRRRRSPGYKPRKYTWKAKTPNEVTQRLIREAL